MLVAGYNYMKLITYLYKYLHSINISLVMYIRTYNNYIIIIINDNVQNHVGIMYIIITYEQ